MSLRPYSKGLLSTWWGWLQQLAFFSDARRSRSHTINLLPPSRRTVSAIVDYWVLANSMVKVAPPDAELAAEIEAPISLSSL